jgi:hypothetical protein
MPRAELEFVTCASKTHITIVQQTSCIRALYFLKVKANFALEEFMKAQRESRGIALLFL